MKKSVCHLVESPIATSRRTNDDEETNPSLKVCFRRHGDTQDEKTYTSGSNFHVIRASRFEGASFVSYCEFNQSLFDISPRSAASRRPCSKCLILAEPLSCAYPSHQPCRISYGGSTLLPVSEKRSGACFQSSERHAKETNDFRICEQKSWKEALDRGNSSNRDRGRAGNRSSPSSFSIRFHQKSSFRALRTANKC